MMLNKLIIILFVSLLLLLNISQAEDFNIEPPKAKPGIDVLLTKKLDLISGKKVGLITNQTGVTSDIRSTIDALNSAPQVKLVALFGPEHGVRGDIEGGQKVPQYVDKKTGVTVYSLYGDVKKPTPEMLKHVQVLIYDIQDIGFRAYTYIYTMALAMEAAKEAGIPVIVLDHPNPLGGNRVEGNVLDSKFSSFVGMYPIPFIYGMTVGELAKLFNEEFNIKCDLTVVPMEGWRREMSYDDTGLTWVPTSPHVPHAETSFLVSTTGCIGELHTVSVGVGYTSPFELIGAPWIDGQLLADKLNSLKLPGVYFRPTSFRPYYQNFIKELCSGVQIHILDKQLFSPAKTQIYILSTINKLYPKHDIFKTVRISSFDKAYGTDQIRLQLMKGISARKIISLWEDDLENFRKIREKYLIY